MSVWVPPDGNLLVGVDEFPFFKKKSFYSTLVRCLKQTGRICLGPLRLSTLTLSDTLPTLPTLQLHCTAALENTITGQEVGTSFSRFI